MFAMRQSDPFSLGRGFAALELLDAKRLEGELMQMQYKLAQSIYALQPLRCCTRDFGLGNLQHQAHSFCLSDLQ